MIRRWWWILLLMAVVGPVLGLLTAAVVTYVMPKKYESTAVVQVNVRTVEVPGSAGGVGEGNLNSLTPQFFGTEFEVIKSRKVLQQVVDALELTKRWGVSDAEAIQTLKIIVVSQNIRGTELITIRVRHTNAEDTRDIAMEVAKAYRDRRAALSNERPKQVLEKLDEALREQEDRVEEKRKTLNKIVGQKGVQSENQINTNELTEARQEFEQARDTLVEMRLKYRTERIQWELPRNPILIHEEPTLDRHPSSPNALLNHVLGFVAGLLLGLLLAFPLMWMADSLTRAGRTRA